jgi:hypothetical protein
VLCCGWFIDEGGLSLLYEVEADDLLLLQHG